MTEQKRDGAPTEIARAPQNVTIERSVRYNRLLIVGAIIGAVIAGLIALMFPVQAEGNYTVAQVVMFSAALGAAIGALLGGLLGIVLGAIAKKHRGDAVAVQTDVQ